MTPCHFNHQKPCETAVWLVGHGGVYGSGDDSWARCRQGVNCAMAGLHCDLLQCDARTSSIRHTGRSHAECMPGDTPVHWRQRSILSFVRVCRVAVWFGFVSSALLLAVGMCVALSFAACLASLAFSV